MNFIGDPRKYLVDIDILCNYIFRVMSQLTQDALMTLFQRFNVQTTWFECWNDALCFHIPIDIRCFNDVISTFNVQTTWFECLNDASCFHIPIDIRCFNDVFSTFLTSKQRDLNVETTPYAFMLQLTQHVLIALFQRFLANNVNWILKRRPRFSR